MKRVTVTGTMDLTTGGCNACGPVESLIYSLEVDGQTLAIEELKVSSLVMALVLHEGWQQEFKFEMIEEFMVYQKADKEVKLIEEYNQLTYSTKEQTLVVEDSYQEQSELFAVVNRVLSEIFELPPVLFDS